MLRKANRVRAAVILGLLGIAEAASGQTVFQGRVASANTGLPVAGAVLIAAAPGRSEVSALSGSDGVFRMAVPAPGVWRVSVSHIGFRDYSVDVETVVARASPPLVISLEAKAISLDGFDVSVVRECPMPSDPERLVALLSELALAFPDAGPQAGYRYEWDVREVGPHNASLDNAWEQTWTDQIRRDTLEFAAEDPIGAMAILGSASVGFVQPALEGGAELFAWEFLVPTAPIVFSQPFREGHCFDVVADREMGRTGVAFSPKRDATLRFDVRGVFWLPSESIEGPSLEFNHSRFPDTPSGDPITQYVSFQVHMPEVRAGRRAETPWPREVVRPDERFGGRIDYSPVPGVGWVPHQIELRYPFLFQGEGPAGGPCCRTREVWGVKAVRRSVWTLLAFDADEAGR